jgi:AcrR family transcriptional regulator
MARVNTRRGVAVKGGPPREPGLRERKKLQKLARIRQAARTLFARKGFDGTTTREIARRAGVATGTLFLYARDKRELLLRLFQEDCRAAVEEAFASIPRGAAFERAVLHTFASLFAHYGRTPELSRVFLKEVLFDPEVAPLAMDDVRRLAGLVADAQRRGEVRADVAPLVAATNLFSIYYFTINTWLGGFYGDATARTMLRELLGLQMRGLR